MIIFLLLILLAAVHPTHSDGNCPLSSVMDLNHSHSFFYPVDVYAPRQILDAVTQRNQMFPCYGALLKEARHVHNCSAAVRFCPVMQHNVLDATRRPFGSSSLCYLQKRLMNPSENVRVIAFGGSVTAGSNAQGCTSLDEAEHKFVHKRCSWFYHFSEWLKHNSTANVTHYNLAHGGHSSYASALTITNAMKLHRLHEFTSNDIIFLDHAANDDQEGRSTLISREVESLIHRIYSLSINNSWPAIIIVDGNPMEHHGKGFKVYPEVYESMARHYDIPMWSYRDAVLSHNATLYQDQYASFLNFSYNDWTQHQHDIHPPWHVHLFMADLYSAIFQYEMNQCSDSDILRTEKLHTGPLHLPSPLSVNKLIMECNREVPDFLSISYDEVKQGLAVGTFKSEPENSWHLGEDGHGRGGFIVERSSNFDAPGGVLSLFLSNTTQELSARFHDVFVQIMYLRTYFNAGKVEVRLCGVHVATLDALWEDHETNRVSVPEWKEVRLVFPECVTRNYTYPRIEFTHKYDERDREYGTVRGHHKVKILSVKVCAENG